MMDSTSGDKDDYNLDFLPKDQADKLKKMYDPEYFKNPITLRLFKEFNLADRLLERQLADSVLAAPLMQVISVTLHKKQDDGTPFEIYGTILIDDGEGPSSIYNRVPSEPQRIHNGGHLMLSIPKGYRAIIPSDKVNIAIKLSGRFPKISDDDDDKIVDFVTASDSWNFQKFRVYDVPLKWKFKGEHGYAIVDYVVYRHAISVTIDAILLKKEKNDGRGNFSQVHGTISARCGNNCWINLLDKKESESVMVEYGNGIELSRAVVAAPAWTKLVIKASLWNRHPPKIIVDGEANDFHAITEGLDSLRILGADDIIHAEVIWKPAYQEHPAASNEHDLSPVVKWLRNTFDERTSVTETIKRNLCSDLRKSLEQTDFPQLEVFSVSVHNSNKDNFSVWGSIKSEEINSFDHFFFSMEKTNAERLVHNQTIPIMFPLKCLKDSVLSIVLDLKDDNDCVISYGSIFWCREDLDTPFWYNRKLCSVIPGDDGYYSAVYYSIFNGGVQALVKVYLIDRSSTMKYAKVYGSIRARYSSFKYSTIDDDEFYTRKLYIRQIEDLPLSFAATDSQSKILLEKSLVSVPRDSALLIDVDMKVNSWGLDFEASNYTNEILRGSAEDVTGRAMFSTEHKIEHWVSEKNFGHQIAISVEWNKC